MRSRIHQAITLQGTNSPHAPIFQELAQDLDVAISGLENLVDHFEMIGCDDYVHEGEPLCVSLDTITIGNPGRSPYVIEYSQIEAMSALGFNFEQISRILGISSRTLRRHRQQLGMPVGVSVYTDMSDKDLDMLIASIKYEYDDFF